MLTSSKHFKCDGSNVNNMTKAFIIILYAVSFHASSLPVLAITVLHWLCMFLLTYLLILGAAGFPSCFTLLYFCFQFYLFPSLFLSKSSYTVNRSTFSPFILAELLKLCQIFSSDFLFFAPLTSFDLLFFGEEPRQPLFCEFYLPF